MKFVPAAGDDEVSEGELHGVSVGEVPVLLVGLDRHVYALGVYVLMNTPISQKDSSRMDVSFVLFTEASSI